MDGRDAKLDELKAFHQSMGDKDHFSLLGVSTTSDDSAIRHAYMKLVKCFGADFFYHVTDSADQAVISEVNRRLREAFDVIGTHAKREVYLATLGKAKGEVKDEHFEIAAVFEAEQALSQAKVLLSRGEYRAALQKLEKARAVNGDLTEFKTRDSYAQYMLLQPNGQGRRDAQKVKKILTTLEEAASQTPACVEVRLYLGDVAKLEGDDRKALSWFKEALKIDKTNSQAMLEIKLFETRKRQAEAPKTFFDKIGSAIKNALNRNQ